MQWNRLGENTLPRRYRDQGRGPEQRRSQQKQADLAPQTARFVILLGEKLHDSVARARCLGHTIDQVR